MKDIEIKIGAVVLKKDKIILIKEKNTDNGLYYWNIVKGTFEPNKDAGVLDTVRRECLEEINSEIIIDKLINIIFYRKKDKIRLQLNFLCSVKYSEPRLSDKQDQDKLQEDISGIKFFSEKEFNYLNKEEFMSERSYTAVKDYFSGLFFDVSILKEFIKS